MMKVKTLVACCGLAVALLFGKAGWAAPETAEHHTVAGAELPGQDPEPPSIYGEQGPPAVYVPGAEGANVGPSNDTSLGRGGTIVPIPPQPNQESYSPNEGIASAGSAEAAGEGHVPPNANSKSLPIFPIIIGVVVVGVVLSFLFKMRRPK